MNSLIPDRVIRHRSNRRRSRLTASLVGLFLAVGYLCQGAATPGNANTPATARSEAFLAPTSLAVTADGATQYVGCESSGEVLAIQTQSKRIVTRIPGVPQVSGLALSANGSRLYATTGGSEGQVCIIDTAKHRVIKRIPGGYQAQSPVLSADGSLLFVCNRFDNCVSIIDLRSERELARIPTPREPYAAAPTADGKHLLAANHLHSGRSDADVVASTISVIDIPTRKVVKELRLPNGSTLVRHIKVSPDGRHAVVAHTLARYHLPTTQIERGWINTNAGTLIDLESLEIVNTVLLDSVDAGAATPWAVDWASNGRHLLITHAGTHELSIIDFPALLAKLNSIPKTADPVRAASNPSAIRSAADVPNDLSFLAGIRQRIRLTGKGPRAIAAQGSRVWVAHYFSDIIDSVELSTTPLSIQTMALGPSPKMSTVRLGESHFNDATLCFQGWQACSSCHSHDARVDGLNWDNLNDGIGNPKNAKSLLLAHATPPSMWLGVRSNAFVAVRAGIRNSLFTVQPPEVAEALDAYLQSLRPMKSPRLLSGRLSASAQRGKQIFDDTTVGCADCHKGPHLTDLRFHDVGTVGRFDQATNRFDTPTLLELWRTGPYLHDGRAATLRSVVTEFNTADKHGKTSHLSGNQVDDLVEYLLSL